MNLFYSQIQKRFVSYRIGFAPPFKAIWLLLIAFGPCFSSLFAYNATTANPFYSLVDTKEIATIQGVVTDETGEPLIGVNILAKGAETGTVTNYDGTYTLNVPEGINTLIFSYTGYKTVEIAIDGRTNIDVIMRSDTEILEEVVVIGYGTVKKSDLTGAVASVEGKDISSIVVGNPTSALQGKISGLQIENNGGEPGGAANVFYSWGKFSYQFFPSICYRWNLC